MAYRNATLFLLSPAPSDGGRAAARLYPAGRQTLTRHNTRLDSGVDLPAPADVVVGPGEVVKINLGVRAVCLRLYDPPPSAVLSSEAVERPWAYRLVPRSSISRTPLILANSEGIIDLGYRGPLIAAVRNVSGESYTIEAGASLFQLVSADLSPPEYEVLPPDDPRTAEYFGAGATERGAGGFGSTGKAGSASSGGVKSEAP